MALTPLAVDPGPPLGIVQADPLVALGAAAVIAVVAAVSALRTAALFGSFGAGSEPRSAEQTNCPACGARTPVDRQHCEYCGESIEE